MPFTIKTLQSIVMTATSKRSLRIIPYRMEITARAIKVRKLVLHFIFGSGKER